MRLTRNACIVGLGRAGRFHLRSIESIKDIDLKYVVDPNIDELQSHFEDKTWEGLSSIETALQDTKLDCVIIASPTSFHYDQVIQSLTAGKHVFSEKPLGKSVQEIRHCFRLANDQKLGLYLGFQRRYDHNFNTLKSQLQSIGEPRILKASSRDNPKPSLSYLSISGNIFHDMLIHDFDMLMYLFGSSKPKSVFAIGQAYDKDIAELNDYDTVLVTVELDNGLICSIDTSRTAPYGYDHRIEVFGANGMLMADNEMDNSVKIFDDRGVHQSKVKHSFPERYKECYLLEIIDFFKGISDGNLFNVTEQECLISNLLADAAHLSAVNKERIDFSGFYKSALSGD